MVCDFCGEKEAIKTILNPNMEDSGNSFWDVCDFCDKYIKEKQEEAIKIIVKDHMARMKNRHDDALSGVEE